jgi:hypothetical protein
VRLSDLSLLDGLARQVSGLPDIPFAVTGVQSIGGIRSDAKAFASGAFVLLKFCSAFPGLRHINICGSDNYSHFSSPSISL